MFTQRTLLVAVLIAASLVTPSTVKSAWAMPNHELARKEPAEQRQIIAAIIAEEFPARVAPRIVAIANCESNGLRHVDDQGELIRNPSGAFAGTLQIALRVHRREIDRLLEEEGRDVLGDVREYVRFSRQLQRARGFTPWPTCQARTARSQRT